MSYDDDGGFLFSLGLHGLVDSLKESPFRKHFDGECLHYESHVEEHKDSEWEITTKGFEMVASSSALKITQLKFDAWMDRLSGKKIQLSEEVLDKWEARCKGLFTFTDEELRKNLRRELESCV